MKRFNFFVQLLLLVAFTMACGKKNGHAEPNRQPAKLRVLGYLFGADNWQNIMGGIDFTRITDLNLAFVNPQAEGHFPANDGFRQVIAKAHDNNVRVFFSIGGGNPPAHLASLLENDKRAGFIQAIVELAGTYNFDGVDVDLENSLINGNYADFIDELSVALRPSRKLLTCALASWNSNLISDATLGKFDFINIMSYDKTGPWNLANPGQHSPFSMVQDDFNYYNKTRNIPAEKLLIGLPFYGYGFGNGAPESMDYRQIVNTYPGAENSDIITLPAGGNIYYNGIPTIRQKVAFAIENKAAGVMIWQLLGDSNDQRSLLNAIHAEAGL